jgi:hypothetical protein
MIVYRCLKILECSVIQSIAHVYATALLAAKFSFKNHPLIGWLSVFGQKEGHILIALKKQDTLKFIAFSKKKISKGGAIRTHPSNCLAQKCVDGQHVH